MPKRADCEHPKLRFETSLRSSPSQEALPPSVYEVGGLAKPIIGHDSTRDQSRLKDRKQLSVLAR
jgi:hypothetical protein